MICQTQWDTGNCLGPQTSKRFASKCTLPHQRNFIKLHCNRWLMDTIVQMIDASCLNTSETPLGGEGDCANLRSFPVKFSKTISHTCKMHPKTLIEIIPTARTIASMWNQKYDVLPFVHLVALQHLSSPSRSNLESRSAICRAGIEGGRKP